MDLDREQLFDLYNKALKELESGEHAATQQILDFWGVKHVVNDENIYKKIQLMLAQEEYTYIYDDKDPRKMTIDSVGYRLMGDKSDFKIFVDQIISEHQRDAVSTSELQEMVDRYNSAVSKYNALGNQVREFPTDPKNPTQNNSSQIWANSFFYKAPYIYPFVSGDFESARLHDETQANYAATVDSYFKKIVERAVLNNGAAMIQITPENACKIVKFSEVPKEEQTLYTQKKSKLEEFLTKFAAKSIDAANIITKPFKQPIPVSIIRPGMEIVLPAGCINPMTGETLPEIKTKVLDSWQLGGQMMISTDAGVITTRDVTRDIYEVIHNKTSELEYKIAHAAEIAEKEAAARREFDYKFKWFERMDANIPEKPRDERLDMDDMSYFGYTPESFRAAAIERDDAYQTDLANYKIKSDAYANELVTKCLAEGIRMIYAGDRWDDFRFYGQTPDDFESPDLQNGAVPNKWTDEVFLPTTCTDAITGKQLGYIESKMKDIWDGEMVGQGDYTNFALIGETVTGEKVMVTSIDIREIARSMSIELSQKQDVVDQNQEQEAVEQEGIEHN